MKPRTKLQFEVVRLSKDLSPISNTQKEWAFNKCLKHVAYRTKSRISCLDCGHTWDPKDTKKKCVCPSCKKKLEIVDTRKLKLDQKTIFTVIETYCGFQVNRYFQVTSSHKTGESAYRNIYEICQQWILPNGKYEFYSRLHHVSFYGNSWTSGFAIREKDPPKYQYYKKDLYNINPEFVYPEIEVLPEIRKHGFRSDFGGISPFDLFTTILSDNKAESLLKMGQMAILGHYIYYRKSDIERYWKSIKICVRNNYKIKDATMWFDYLDFLSYFRKDVLNAKYICPENLKEEHNRLSIKKTAKIEKEKAERDLLEASKNEKLFQELKSKFFGLAFTDGLIQVRALESIQEFADEGKEMHHCVFSNGYYLKPNSLILSAMIEDERIETVEVSLETLKVVQSRGVCNENTEYHDRIIKLVNKNKRLIRKRLTA